LAESLQVAHKNGALRGDRIGLVVDLETTGLDTAKAEILEIAAVKFSYVDDRITSVIDTLQAFQQPSVPILPAITALTGITDAMVEGTRSIAPQSNSSFQTYTS
jgi:DNA polymerase III epsilon subunit-like protein